MIDYKKIADGDPGGDLEVAFAAMAVEEVVVTPAPEKLMTYRSIANEVGFAASGELEAGVLDASNGMPQWLNIDLQSRGIDVNNPNVAGLIGALVTATTATNILAAGVTYALVYPNLKAGHLETSRIKRLLEGEV